MDELEKGVNWLGELDEFDKQPESLRMSYAFETRIRDPLKVREVLEDTKVRGWAFMYYPWKKAK